MVTYRVIQFIKTTMHAQLAPPKNPIPVEHAGDVYVRV